MENFKITNLSEKELQALSKELGITTGRLSTLIRVLGVDIREICEHLDISENEIKHINFHKNMSIDASQE